MFLRVSDHRRQRFVRGNLQRLHARSAVQVGHDKGGKRQDHGQRGRSRHTSQQIHRHHFVVQQPRSESSNILPAGRHGIVGGQSLLYGRAERHSERGRLSSVAIQDLRSPAKGYDLCDVTVVVRASDDGVLLFERHVLQTER